MRKNKYILFVLIGLSLTNGCVFPGFPIVADPFRMKLINKSGNVIEVPCIENNKTSKLNINAEYVFGGENIYNYNFIMYSDLRYTNCIYIKMKGIIYRYDVPRSLNIPYSLRSAEPDYDKYCYDIHPCGYTSMIYKDLKLYAIPYKPNDRFEPLPEDIENIDFIKKNQPSGFPVSPIIIGQQESVPSNIINEPVPPR